MLTAYDGENKFTNDDVTGYSYFLILFYCSNSGVVEMISLIIYYTLHILDTLGFFFPNLFHQVSFLYIFLLAFI